ncbi:family 1 glycosylhydrolase, partial [Brevundimonas sp.]|uniref:family 1 glycosylhydrolase n=1 Tax=Brevundimonas sp. TaxID=1871086 RepID=UPI0017C47110
MTSKNTGNYRFPEGFLWGAATAAYQIEGSSMADGAGVSIWDRFSHTPGMMLNGDTGDVACDHYNRWREDIDLMTRLNLQAYRFSVSWSRVMPEGRGRINDKGLAFYDRLVDGLLEKGIEPLCTLYHWDLPAALDDRGGWLNPDIADWFADYGQVLFEKFKGRVKTWGTINEPWVIVDGGYLHGALAPGHRSAFEAMIAGHNVLRAHGAAVKRFREVGEGQIGIVLNIEPKYPASDKPEDEAARKRAEAQMNRWFLDPLMGRGYPEELKDVYGEAYREFPQEDFDLIATPTDWMGLNWYTRSVPENAPDAWPVRARPVKQIQHAHTETGWEVYPPALTDTLVWLHEQTGGKLPLMVTENGSAWYDPPHAIDGRI